MRADFKQVVFQVDSQMWSEFKVLAANQKLGAVQMLRMMIDQLLADNPDHSEPILFDGPRVCPPGTAGRRILPQGHQWVCTGGKFEVIEDSA